MVMRLAIVLTAAMLVGPAVRRADLSGSPQSAGHEGPAYVRAQLADAAEHADWPKVRALVKPTADVNATQADGMTALHWAVYHDSAEIAALLVAAHANVSAANRYGITPWSLAC